MSDESTSKAGSLCAGKSCHCVAATVHLGIVTGGYGVIFKTDNSGWLSGGQNIRLGSALYAGTSSCLPLNKFA